MSKRRQGEKDGTSRKTRVGNGRVETIGKGRWRQWSGANGKGEVKTVGKGRVEPVGKGRWSQWEGG